MAQIDIEAFREREAQHLISCHTHREANLLIWNYTARCQYQAAWDDVTMQARGLITRPDGTIVARPFRKFRNLDEHLALGLPLPTEPFEVTEKMDGSLGILYWLDGMPAIATRGSFHGTQARHATDVFRARYAHHEYDPEVTLLFEIVYPENRIVVDYGALDDLVLLAAIETETGRELPLAGKEWQFPIVQHYDGITNLRDLTRRDESNREGFVVRFESGLRLKLKFGEYKRLHKLLTGITARDIWEMLATSTNFEAILERVPDEFYQWVTATRQDFLTRYAAIETASRACYEHAAALPSRKEQAAVATSPGAHNKAVVFRMLDGKPYADLIWKLLRPAAEEAFKQDEA